MDRRSRPVDWRSLFGGGLLLAAAAIAGAASLPPGAPFAASGVGQKSAAPARITLKPKLVPGGVLRYQVQFQTQSATRHGGSFQDLQGPAQLVVTWDATVRMEVLGPARSGAAPATRLRTTYEKSAASVQSDTPDPSAGGIEKQYARLEGRSIELTLGDDGRVSDVRGLDEIVSDADARKAIERWMAQLAGPGAFPAAGIVVGQRWTSQQAAGSLPLAGLAWRTNSTYLRNEACHPAEDGGAGAAADSCAVILSDISLVTTRSSKNPTPEEYRRNGIRSSGRWTGSGQGLSYVSLKTGWLVSATQTGTEQMDVTISKAQGSTIHYAGSVRTRSSVAQVPDEAAAP